MPPGLEVGHEDSGGERLQRRLPDAHVVKTLNTVGNRQMVDPDLPGGRPVMFLAGDDADAKAVVREILDAFGWDACDVGGIARSRELESLCILWVAVMAARGGATDHAITLVQPG
jgi:predicted dinucleotide-binding enzyme